MSTRCNIIVRQDNNSIILYHHHDGYPSGVGQDLKDFLSEFNNPEWGKIVNGLLKGGVMNAKSDGTLEKDMEYEVTTCIHGDIEFLYIVDCDEKRVRCFSYSRNVYGQIEREEVTDF